MVKNYPLEKYRFYRHGDTTIAISTYGGREVKGYAKVDPQDSYNEQFGKELAAARCNAKIANKRMMAASRKMLAAAYELDMAQKKFAKMQAYRNDATEAASAAENKVNSLIFGNQD